MPDVYYPAADHRVQWFGGTFAGVTMPAVEKLLLHTTETAGWPGYKGGATAPTLTYHPGKHQWRQHFRINQSARALQDPSGTSVRENRDGVVQVEICCSCDRTWAVKHGIVHVTDIDNQAIDDIGRFAAWLHTEWGVPLTKAPLWPAYPASYGNSAARMSSSEFNAFRGICGHMHASGNDHGDPGAIAIDRILATAKRIANPPSPPSTEDDDVQPTDVVGYEIDPKTKKRKPITMEVFVGRMTWLYNQHIEGGKTDAQLDRIEAETRKDT